jgi:hypothetical protein
MTPATFLLTLIGALLAVFGFLAGGSVPMVTLGIVALIAAGGLEVLGERRAGG